MAVDLKFELFAHDLFCKIFFENDVRDKICDGRVHYVDECIMDIQSHQQQIYDDCFYQAVVCRQYFFRRVFYGIFKENPDFYTTSYSDFCDYVHITFNRQDLFGHLHLFDHMFASCAFVADLCLFCYSIGNRNFIKIAHLCWALYFDRFSEEFYIKGGWRSFRKLALSYSLPFRLLTTHIEPKMPSSYMFVSLTKLHLALESFLDFWNSGLEETRTFSKNWIEFRRCNSEAFQFVNRQNEKVPEEPQNAEQAENLLLHLLYFCLPTITVTRIANEKAEFHSSEDVSEFLSGEEKNSYFSDDECITRLMDLKDKELLKINEKNKIQIPKSEENLLQVCETEEIFHPSEKDSLLQQISDAENLLQQYAESDKMNRLLSEYEDLKEFYDHNQKFTDGENDLKVPGPEKNSLQHSEQETILKQLFETKNKILELYKKNEAKFSKKANPTISEFQTNSEKDKDKVSLTHSSCESMLNISPKIISQGAEFLDSYFAVKDQNSFSHCTNHQDSDVQNIHKGPLIPYQEEPLSSDKKKKSASKEHEGASSFDIHLNPENPIVENQNNSTYEEATLLSDNEVKPSLSKGNLPSSDPYLISENPVIESNIQINESIELKKSKQSYELPSIIEKFKEFCSISDDSEISSLKIEDREKGLFLAKDRRSVCPIDDNPENCSSNPTKIHCSPINNQLMTEQHTKTEEQTSSPLDKQKAPYLSASIKEDVGENIAIGKISSSIKIKSAITYEESSDLSRFSKELKTYNNNNGGTSPDFSVNSTTRQQDQNIPSTNKSSTILDKVIQLQNALSSSILKQEANNNDLDILLGSKETKNLDASEKTDSKVNSSDINCPHSESQSKEVILNNKVQCLDVEPFCSENAIPLENTKKSNKCDPFLQTLTPNRNLNQGPTLQTIDEKKILINNILILGVKNKRSYLTSIFKNTQL